MEDIKKRISKINSLVELLYKTDISTAPIGESALDRIYEARTILNLLIWEANQILNIIE